MRDKIGTDNYTNAQTGTYVLDCIVNAEVAYSAEQLWRRRIAFLDAAASINLDANNRAAMLKEARALADEAAGDKVFWLDEAQRALGLDVQADLPGTGVSTGMIETGIYPQVARAARNFGGVQ